MAHDLIIRNVTLVTGNGCSVQDIAFEGGKVAEVSTAIQSKSDQEVDGTGKHLFPGFIDTQVHFREPGLTHKETIATGTLAAIAGGVTSVLEMPNTNPATVSSEAHAAKCDIASKTASCDIGFFIGASPENIGALKDLEVLPGCPGVKIFVGSSTGSLLIDTDELLEQVLADGKNRCSIHSEHEPRIRERNALYKNGALAYDHPFIRDAEAAVLSTLRVLALVKKTGRPVHILHISTAEEIDILRTAKDGGLPVTCEVTPQHLTFCAEADYPVLGTKLQMNPPVRSESHRKRIEAGLRNGIFDVFGSDHAPHLLSEKALPYDGGSPSGMPGVQTFATMILKFVQLNWISIETACRMACETPADMFRIKVKGRLKPGFDADAILVDMNTTQKWKQELNYSKTGWSPYDGREVGPVISTVFLRGEVVAQENKVIQSGKGKVLAFDRS